MTKPLASTDTTEPVVPDQKGNGLVQPSEHEQVDLLQSLHGDREQHGLENCNQQTAQRPRGRLHDTNEEVLYDNHARTSAKLVVVSYMCYD